jgi:hypothetical protein
MHYFYSTRNSKHAVDLFIKYYFEALCFLKNLSGKGSLSRIFFHVYEQLSLINHNL